MAAAHENYNFDFTSADFAAIEQNMTWILANNTGALLEAINNAGVLETGGMKNSKMYRFTFNRRFLHGRNDDERRGWLLMIFINAFVNTRERVARVVMGLPTSNMKTAMTRILQSFRDTRGRGGSDDVNTFRMVNVSGAYPDLVTVARMLVLTNRPQSRWTMPNLNAEGYAVRNEDGRVAFGNNQVTWEAWRMSRPVGQLAVTPQIKREYYAFNCYFWERVVTGDNAGWKADADDWWNRTTMTDYYRLPAINTPHGGLVTCAMTGAGTGPDGREVANSRYTWANLTEYRDRLVAGFREPEA